MKISIITINYRNLEGLKKTVHSVIEQTSTDIEYIVIDGDSQDGTKEFLASQNDHLSYWISEPDSGIYNAMNKGIKKATGAYLLFLNSGDILFDNQVIARVMPSLSSGEDFIAGNLLLDEKPQARIKQHPKTLSMSFLFKGTIAHPSCFINKTVFEKYGLYDEQLSIVSDWKLFFVALGLNGASFKSIDSIISTFDMTGISSLEEQAITIKKEKQRVINAYLKPARSNDMDAYILNHFKERSKRFESLYVIDKSPFTRKITTIILQFLAWLCCLGTNSNAK